MFTMQVNLLFLAACLSVLVTNVSGLVCLSCASIYQPRHCHDVEECRAGQYCAVEKFSDRYGDVYYNVGCMDKQKCHTNQTAGIPDGSTLQCSECCQDDLCNSNLCGAPGYTTQTGPICYSCNTLPANRACRHIDQCEQDEVCFAEEKEEYGDILIHSGCRSRLSCHVMTDSVNHQGVIVGKRSANSRSLTHKHCSHCCDQRLCNRKCDVHPQTIKATTRQPLTTTSTTTTTATTTTTIMTTTTTTAATTTAKSYERDCLAIKLKQPSAQSGPYEVELSRGKLLMVWCDMITDGGGWTVFQKRYDGSVDFYKNFAPYRDGFGKITGEFWLGLDNIFMLTTGNNNSLRVDFTQWNGTRFFEQIQSFNIGPGLNYTLHVGRHSTGLPVNQMYAHDGMVFSTKDRDQYANCASSHHGGFWYFGCFHYINPNGQYDKHAFIHMSYIDRKGCQAIQMKFRRNI